MDELKITLIVFISIFVFVIILLAFSTTSYFKNLTIDYKYKLPVVGTVPDIQSATVPRMYINYEEPTSSEEPTSYEEPTSSEEPTSYEEPNHFDQSRLISLYANEKRNMNLYGNYKVVSALKKQESLEIDNLLKRLHDASNSALIQ